MSDGSSGGGDSGGLRAMRVSRRTVLKAVVASGAVASSAALLTYGCSQQPQTAAGSVARLITLNVNGKPRPVDVLPNETLAMTLRYKLGLTGTKLGCDRGECGACTVHVDGKAIRSCQTPVQTAANKTIRTIEGLSPEGLHPVQQAWMELDVPQCGYCQAGQIMSAVALLEKTPKPSDQDINQAMSGNLCRCGTYLRIRQAIHRAAELGQTKPVGSTAQAGER